jgi:hypothetical protein
LGGESLYGFGAEVGHDQSVAAVYQAPGHVGAHLSQPYHSQLHSCSLTFTLLRTRADARRLAILLHNLFYQRGELRESCFDIAADMYTQCATLAICQDLEISARLGRLYDSECVFLSESRSAGRVALWAWT